MGSDSDMPTMIEAATICKQFDVPYEIHIVSAHRTPDDMANYGKNAHLKGIKVIIAGAGGAAHLPGMTAAYSPLRVFPCRTRVLHDAGTGSTRVSGRICRRTRGPSHRFQRDTAVPAS